MSDVITYGSLQTHVWCCTCAANVAVSRPVLQITDDGIRHIATFITCPPCETRRLRQAIATRLPKPLGDADPR